MYVETFQAEPYRVKPWVFLTVHVVPTDVCFVLDCVVGVSNSVGVRLPFELNEMWYRVVFLEQCVSLRLPSRDVLWNRVCVRLRLVNSVSIDDGCVID